MENINAQRSKNALQNVKLGQPTLVVVEDGVYKKLRKPREKTNKYNLQMRKLYKDYLIRFSPHKRILKGKTSV